MKTTDRIGFLPDQERIDFSGGSFKALPDYADTWTQIKQGINEDGYLYPPMIHRVQATLKRDKTGAIIGMKPGKKIPGTRRPAHLHRLPPSHELILNGRFTQSELRDQDGGFVMHLAAYLFGVRLQFHDWWFDGRVPLKSNHNIYFPPSTVGKFFSTCYSTWKGWKADERRLATNLLYMNSRSPTHLWDWERFVVEYMVLDGCYKLAASLYGVVAKSHADRIQVLCQRFQVPLKPQWIRTIVTLRNGLFHEALWDGQHPGTARSSEAFQCVYILRKLNQRLIPPLLGFDTDYTRSNPEIRTTMHFE